MKKPVKYPIVVSVIWLMGIFLSGCSADARGGTTEGGAADSQATAPNATANPFAPVVTVNTVTPAPSGFVPGDTLPTPVITPVGLYPSAATPTPVSSAPDGSGQFREITWEELVPPGFRAEDIIAKYQDQLDAFADGDPAAWDLYTQMQQEFNNAPINTGMNQAPIKLAGFIAPLEYSDGLITAFLLVPYFGACIHVPPPPVNQTVFVTVADGEGITPEEAYYPVWVEGYLMAEGLSTDIGEAGYRVENADLTIYEYPTG